MAQAKSAVEKKQYSVAIDIYEQLLKKNPQDVEAMTAIAYVFAWNQDYLQADIYFKKVLAISSKDHDSLLGLARVYYWQENYKIARQSIAQFLGSYPEDPEGQELKRKIETALDDQYYWQINLGYIYQNISFADDANGGNLLVSYVKNKKWGIRAGVDTIDKFSDLATSMHFGGTYWPDKKLALSVDALIAPNQVVVPKQSYSFLGDYTLHPKIVTSLGYRFADYETADVHTFSPSLQWYWHSKSDLFFKYSLSLTQLSSSLERDHSFSFRAGWQLLTPLYVYAGYARTSESFNPGNSISSAGRFKANHFLTGVKVTTKYKLNFTFDIDYEDRDNSTSVNTLAIGLQKKF